MENNTEWLAVGCILISCIPYAWRIWIDDKKNVNPSLATWILWNINSLTIFLTYREVNHGENIEVVIASLIDTTIIVVLLLIKSKGKFILKGRMERLSFGGTLVLILFWVFAQNLNHLLGIAFILSIVIELTSSYSQMMSNFSRPDKERPFAWIIYGLGYTISYFSIKEISFYTIILPIFMSIFYFLMSVPLVAYRIKNKIHITKWV
ncbi:MAG: hypothetical protein M3P22_01155 [bacterium]|nr:hypothetical protein [bacterium]